MGSSCSCQDRLCGIRCQLMQSAKRRRAMKGCQCNAWRPSCMRIRRKTSYTCSCNRRSRKDKSMSIVRCGEAPKECPVHGLDKVKGPPSNTNTCSAKGPDRKNVCRFTVDAYFT
ncbi:uncharacterized protein LOC113227380 [Hyposmocoma kahamanoa]|uniref:uncharacterized protein LOC113227380 n=1 Tax=Hyposmocoma kahamanoa TaxID=1477025 RepID=UPI000E6D900F|nr:uncharacterized protein LOC113227380 [Hyposmocoma kahamanoa]